MQVGCPQWLQVLGQETGIGTRSGLCLGMVWCHSHHTLVKKRHLQVHPDSRRWRNGPLPLGGVEDWPHCWRAVGCEIFSGCLWKIQLATETGQDSNLGTLIWETVIAQFCLHLTQILGIQDIVEWRGGNKGKPERCWFDYHDRILQTDCGLVKYRSYVILKCRQ
jgi:hypothetical protein